MKTYEERTERILEKAKAEKKRRKTIKIASVTAGALALALTLNLVLFVPYSVGGVDIAKYENSEYFPVIRRLSDLTYSNQSTTNNFNEWFASMKVSCGDASEAPTAEMSGNHQQYNEVTNNQTEGVVEGDLFKRSDKYVYYLNYRPDSYDTVLHENGEKELVHTEEAYVLQAYSIAGAQSELVASFEILPEENTTFRNYESEREMFLSADCNAVTVFTPCYNTQNRVLYTALIRIDVSDLDEIRITDRTYVSGQYVSSRMTGEDFLLVSRFTVRWNPDFSEEAQFLPQTGAAGEMTSLPIGNIVLPDTATSAMYTVICMLNGDTLAVKDCAALLSYSDEVYVSAGNLYIPRSTTGESVDDTYRYLYRATEIYRVAYSESGLELKGSCEVKGTINDRYSMDEYEGVLRVFTTSCYDSVREIVSGGSVAYSQASLFENSADLYCIDLDSMEIIASVERFAPAGESVKSARFAGNRAYVCTAAVTYIDISVIIDDPVFAFDLSDYDHITYTDTGTIPGYSLSLISFADGALLGIGYGDAFETLKIEVYRETESEVISVAEYRLENTDFSDQFKAYYVDQENALVGLGVYKDGRYVYLLLRFDGYNLKEVCAVPTNDSDVDAMRAAYIDGFLYLFGYTTFEVLAVA